MARSVSQDVRQTAESAIQTTETLKQRLLAGVGPERRDEALETLEIGRLRDRETITFTDWSWSLERNMR